LKNSDDEMAVMALTMRAKQPKRGVVSCERRYIEVNECPRAASATITYTSDGHTEVIEVGESKKALEYEIKDMEDYISNQSGEQNLQYIRDVMATLTSVRNQWGMVYPFE
jgi:hypothetical protein